MKVGVAKKLNNSYLKFIVSVGKLNKLSKALQFYLNIAKNGFDNIIFQTKKPKDEMVFPFISNDISVEHTIVIKLKFFHFDITE